MGENENWGRGPRAIPISIKRFVHQSPQLREVAKVLARLGFAVGAVIIWDLSLLLEAPSGLLLGHLAAVVALTHWYSGRQQEALATGIAMQAQQFNILTLRVAKALADLAEIQARIDRALPR